MTVDTIPSPKPDDVAAASFVHTAVKQPGTAQHGVLFPCSRQRLPTLIAELTGSDLGTTLPPCHAAIIEHTGRSGELSATIAGDGRLGALVGRPVDPTALTGPLLMAALSRISPANAPTLADALTPDQPALLIVLGGGTNAKVHHRIHEVVADDFIQFDVPPRLVPWLASKVDVDMTVEAASRSPLGQPIAS
jgi:hypothetical protein